MSLRAVVRPARPEDLATVRALVSAMGGHELAASGPGLAFAFAQALASPLCRVLVAEAGGEVVGYLDLQVRPSVSRGEREGWIGGLAVAPSHRGAGVGSVLLAAAERAAATLGCDTLTVESSDWREGAHRFYRERGFVEAEPPARRFRRPVAGPATGELVDRFLHCAAMAASAAGAAIVGVPASSADCAAEEAALRHLDQLGLPVCSEESGLLGPPLADPDGVWISLDPLDGSRNYRVGHPPWATAIGLVRSGRAVAGLVLDHTSGRRWWAATRRGAFVDGEPAHPRAGGLLATPSLASASGALPPMGGYERCRMSGATAIDLCRVADGSLGAFADLDRAVVHTHDLAGSLAVLEEAGACVLDSAGLPVRLEPDPTRGLTLVAAATHGRAMALLGTPGVS